MDLKKYLWPWINTGKFSAFSLWFLFLVNNFVAGVCNAEQLRECGDEEGCVAYISESFN